jgi:glucokinase
MMKRKYILAADVGGTTIECGLFDRDGRLLNSKKLLTKDVLIHSSLAEGLVEEMKRRIDEQGIQIADIDCVGLGVPGLIDAEVGMIIKAPSLNCHQYPLADRMKELLSVPVFVGNDVNTGLLGEMEMGGLQGIRHAVYFMVGTSIGAGLLLNGEVYKGGPYSAAGEVGHMVTDERVMRDGYAPARSGYGFLSTQAGGYGMAHKYITETGAVDVTAEGLFKLAESGDSVALRIIDESVSHIATSIVNIAVLFNPEVILLGGGVGTQLAPHLEKWNGMLEKYAPVRPELRISPMENQSVLYGAYALCRKRL